MVAWNISEGCYVPGGRLVKVVLSQNMDHCIEVLLLDSIGINVFVL